ncbi:hypothetical protein DXG03_008388 [Asterophora parasitica]|uniref:Uncharacterized protein n=1 Tax=Asterophora parasitica TaxID=117018 RepID=A0A9P7GI11_9AGAR|nr:hypothetical protein DXG03_008388 [Asterophora parasitica]
MATSLAGLSASVTRILYLTGFPKELKTKDIQSAFSEYDSLNGGFKIKWRDDTSLLIVFQDPSVAKRAYLNTIASPPAILTSSMGVAATIRPYDGPDAQSIIQTVNSRGQHNSNPSRSHNARSASVSVFPTTRTISGSSSVAPNRTSQNVAIPENQHPNGREPSPTLPSLPSHPTLNYLINSSLGEAVAGAHSSPPSDPAILATSLHPDLNGLNGTGGPRIGDPGKRMLGAALGVRHPSLGPRVISGNGGSSGGSPPGTSPSQGGGVDQAMREVQKAMGGLVVAE